MLKRFRVRGFKSLDDVELEAPKLLLFGPNAVGKSNFVEAFQCLSRLVTEHSIKDALAMAMRGYPHDAFRIPEGGVRELMSLHLASFTSALSSPAEDGVFEALILRGLVDE